MDARSKIKRLVMHIQPFGDVEVSAGSTYEIQKSEIASRNHYI